eukprot:g12609.t1
MPPRRSVKKKGRFQKLEAASESILLQAKGNDAASPAGSVSDDDAFDDIEADKDNRHGNKRPAGDGLSQYEMQTEYVEKIIEEVERKARVWCDDIMDESATNIQTQMRARDRVKKKINSKFRHMKLADLCHMSGNDLNATLLMAVPPEERTALLAETGGFEEEEEDAEEEMPTAVKGKNPPRMVPATPKGGGRPPAGGRVTRSALKGGRPAAATATAAAAVAQTPSRRGRGGAGSRVTRSVIKGKAPGDGGGRDASPPQTSIENAPELSEEVVSKLHKRFNPDCTVWQCLDIIFQPKIEGYTRHAETVCAELRQNIAQRSAQLRARVAPAERKRKKPRNVKSAKPKAAKPKAAKAKANPRAKSKRGAAAAKKAAASEPASEEVEEGGDGEAAPPLAMEAEEKEEGEVVAQEEGEEEEEEAEMGGTAKVVLSIEGGPYDGSVFAISVEEDGDARLVGRSTGKKFKNHGISLRRDSEVSITHGMFMNSRGAVTYMDNGSTNGSELDGEWVDPKKPYEITAGSTLVIGQSTCTVAITWEG